MKLFEASCGVFGQEKIDGATLPLHGLQGQGVSYVTFEFPEDHSLNSSLLKMIVGTCL